MSEVSNPTKVKKTKLKKKQKTKVLLTKSIFVDIQNVHINFSTSFMRLVVLIERETENEKYFNYELTPGPMLLLLLYK